MCAVVHCMRRLCMWQVQGLPGHDDAALEVGALPCPPPAVLGFRRTTRTWGGVAAGASAAAALWQWNPRVRPSKMPSFYLTRPLLEDVNKNNNDMNKNNYNMDKGKDNESPNSS